MNYIVAAAQGLHCFFHKRDSVWHCKFSNGVWSEAEVLIQEMEDDFTVNLVDGEVVMIGRHRAGSLIKCKFDGSGVVSNILIQGDGNIGRYHAVCTKDGMNLIYNMPISQDGGHMLVSQFLGENGAWGAMKHIDNVNGSFILIPVTDKHFLVFYQNGGNHENRLGYREIYGNEVGGYNLLHSSTNRFADCSFLATMYDIHGLYVVRSVFGSALAYRRKLDGGFSPRFVVAEGQSIHNVLLYMLDERLCISFIKNNDLYSVDLNEEGDIWNFSPPKRHEKPHGVRITKAVFLTNDKESRFLTNELLVNADKPWEILMNSDYVIMPNSEKRNLQTAACSEEDYNSFFDSMENELKKLRLKS